MFHVSKHYGSTRALSDTTLDIAKNEFLLIRGPSGAGKTTLLKLLYLGEQLPEPVISKVNLVSVGFTVDGELQWHDAYAIFLD